MGSLRSLRKRGESPPLEIFEDDTQGLGELEDNADIEEMFLVMNIGQPVVLLMRILIWSAKW